MIFTPPAVNRDPPVFPKGDPQQTSDQYYARRRYSGHLTGQNVYLLVGNVVTTEQPWDQSTILKTWFGGHTEPVTAAEAALLTAAGFGAYLH